MKKQDALAGAVAALIMVAACGRKAGPPQFPPPEVSIIEMRPGTVSQSYEFTGEVVSYRRVQVRSRVEGIIEQRPFTEGSLVQAGQVLYRLERVRYDAAYRSALARFENAKRTYDRIAPLVAEHAIAQQQVDNAQSELESAQAALRQAKKDLDDTDVRAEIEGRVGRTMLDVGARVTGPADQLTTIDRLDPVYVTLSTVLRAARRVARGSRRSRPHPAGEPARRCRWCSPTGRCCRAPGKLDFVAPALDAETGTQEFRSVFANADRLLMPGQFVRVRLAGFARDSALAVPLRAVLSGLGRQFVYVVGAGDTAVARDVHPGPWSGDSGSSTGACGRATA